MLSLASFGVIALARCVHAHEVSAWSEGDLASFAAAAERGAVDEISLDWYVSERDASVGAWTEDLGLVAAAHARGVRVLATVADVSVRTGRFTSGLSSRILQKPSRTAAHVAALVDLCVSKGYDGIDVDWEAVRPRKKDRFSAFIADLAAALHAQGKTLSMALGAKDSEPGTWSAPQSEDYAALGAVVDEFKVMTYDYSYSNSLPGPIAPLAWIDAVLLHAESLVPASKIMMGVPFYGYDWIGRRGTSVTYDEAEDLVVRYGATVSHDPSGEATFGYVDGGGRTHAVYFQDRAALVAKLRLLTTQHPAVRGIAIWVMGGEDPAFWDDVRAALH